MNADTNLPCYDPAVSPEIFHSSAEGDEARAKAICNGSPARTGSPERQPCPRRAKCLTACLEFESANPGSRWGVWGGTTANERTALVKRGKGSAA